MQGLEDRFDHQSRKRLEGFIVPDGTAAILGESEKHEVGEFVTVQEQQDDGNNNKAKPCTFHLPRRLARTRCTSFLHRYARVPDAPFLPRHSITLI